MKGPGGIYRSNGHRGIEFRALRPRLAPDDRPQMSGEKCEISELVVAKRALRKTSAASRDHLSVGYRADAAAQIAAIGLGFAATRPGLVVSAYSAMGSEIDPASLVERLAAAGFRTCLPVIRPLGQPLTFRGWRPGEPLVARTWGIREPADEAPEVDPDILLIPLLAFDRHGMRLGYGGGYYDRTLSRLRSLKPITTIGLAFREQEMPEVPCGPNDQRLDWVLTGDGPIKTGATHTTG